MATEDKDEDLKPEDSKEEIDTTKKVEDETTEEEDDTKSDDEAEGDDGEEDSDDDKDDDKSDDDETEDEDKPEFKKRFTQIKGDNPDEYIPNLEEAYRNSSTEAQRLATTNKELQGNMDAIAAAVAKNPDLAKAIADATGDNAVSPVADPALLQARQDMEDRMDKEYNTFRDSHPELESDPEVNKKVLETLSEFGAAARKQGRVLGMAEGLKKAWAFHGFDNSKEEVASKAKDIASKGRTTNGGKKVPSSKSSLTPEQIAVGKKFGLTEQQLIDANK